MGRRPAPAAPHRDGADDRLSLYCVGGRADRKRHDRRELWAGRFEDSSKDVLNLQQHIAREIAGTRPGAASALAAGSQVSRAAASSVARSILIIPIMASMALG
jgi:hypothetical protein